MNHKKAKTKINHAIRRTTIILIMLACIIMLINLAPNYIKISKLENTRLVINNNDVTNSLRTLFIFS